MSIIHYPRIYYILTNLTYHIISHFSCYLHVHGAAAAMDITGSSIFGIRTNEPTYSESACPENDENSFVEPAPDIPTDNIHIEDLPEPEIFPEVHIKMEVEDVGQEMTDFFDPMVNNEGDGKEDHDRSYADIDNRRLLIKVEPLDPELVQVYLEKLKKPKKRRGRPPGLTTTGRPARKKPRRISDKNKNNGENSRQLQPLESEFVQPLRIRFKLSKGTWNADESPERISEAELETNLVTIRKRGRKRKPVIYRNDSESDDNPDPPEILSTETETINPVPEKRKTKTRKPKKTVTNTGESGHRKRKRQQKEADDDTHPPQIGPCSACNLKFHTDEELSTHSCRKYYELPNGRFQCGVCNLSLSRKKEMPSHLRRHTGTGEIFLIKKSLLHFQFELR